jgi:hypothetical protein
MEVLKIIFHIKAMQDSKRIWQHKKSYIRKKDLEQEHFSIRLRRFFCSMLPNFIMKGATNDRNQKDNI